MFISFMMQTTTIGGEDLISRRISPWDLHKTILKRGLKVGTKITSDFFTCLGICGSNVLPLAPSTIPAHNRFATLCSYGLPMKKANCAILTDCLPDRLTDWLTVSLSSRRLATGTKGNRINS